MIRRCVAFQRTTSARNRAFVHLATAPRSYALAAQRWQRASDKYGTDRVARHCWPISANAMAEDTQAAKRGGYIDNLVKPAPAQAVLALIDRLLERSDPAGRQPRASRTADDEVGLDERYA